jgi:glucose-6-phosphate isomerase
VLVVSRSGRTAETLERLQRFVTEVAAEADPMVGNALVAVLLAFAGPTAIVEAC